MRDWTGRQWSIAGGVAAGAALTIGVITDLIPNPLFTRMIEAPWWSYPVWLASAALSGVLAATYVVPTGTGTERPRRGGLAGAVLSFLAVGCPTCNKLVVVALGTSGAITWFQPLQPVLAVLSLGLLGYAVRARLRAARSCRIPAGQDVRTAETAAGGSEA